MSRVGTLRAIHNRARQYMGRLKANRVASKEWALETCLVSGNRKQPLPLSQHGGNGPDAELAYAAQMRREELASESSFVVLQCDTSTNPLSCRVSMSRTVSRNHLGGISQ